jgi:iron(III) transport system ATP-binding protein
VSDVALRGITRSFGATQVLHGIDLDVPSGHVTAILGPSGCGKTTLLRLIAGFDDPDTGSICVGPTVVFSASRSVPAERRHIGYVAQEGALFPHLSVRANLAFGLSARGAEANRVIDELLDLVGLHPALARRYPHELSGGQQQRVALARALAPRPAIVLLDEPFSSLDAALRDATRRAVFEALARTVTTTLLVTHDQAEALSVADQVAVMFEGQLVQVGAPAAVYATPVDMRVARFLGEANVLPVHVCGDCAMSDLGSIQIPPGHADGQAQVLLRPEQLALTSAQSPGSVEARVAACTFYGPYASIELELIASGRHVIARVPGFEVLAGGGEIVGLKVIGQGVVYPSIVKP